MRARIFRMPKSAMQSGMATAEEWRLEFPPSQPGRADPLMGWIGGADTQSQVGLNFPSREAAVAYAERAGLAYDLELPPPSHGIKPKVYADNFRFGRAENWTH
jgi:hypothetical protein